MLSQLLSGVLVTHRTPLAISPSHFRISAFALSRNLCELLVHFETPNPDPRCQRSTDPILSGISLSGNRRMKSSESLTFQIPNADARCHVLYSTPSPWDPSPLGISLLPRVSFDFKNAEVPSLDSTGSCDTCPHSNRRL
jgi:hypothetical protein